MENTEKNIAPTKDELLKNVDLISSKLDKVYLEELSDVNKYNVAEIDKKMVTYSSNIRVIKAVRWVYDQDEKIIDCFKNVVNTFSGSGSSLSLIFHRKPDQTDCYFVTKNNGVGKNSDSKGEIELLQSSLLGNFQGSKFEDFERKEAFDLICGEDDDVTINKEYKTITSLCNLPSDKSEDYISQGIEKLLNGVKPTTEAESYIVMMLAESITPQEVRTILAGNQDLTTAIAPFATHQFAAGKNKAETEGTMDSFTSSKNISESISKTKSANVGVFISGIGGGVGYAKTKGTSEGSGTAKTIGTNRGISVGDSETTTYTYKSYLVNDLIEKLEANIKRINEGRAMGLWRCSTYILSKKPEVGKMVSNYLQSISQGETSYIDSSFMQQWHYYEPTIKGERTPYDKIADSIIRFTHPIFEGKGDKILVTSTIDLTTTEVAKLFAFPRNSVQGLPVIGCARFGREPHSLTEMSEDVVKLGSSYHMRNKETNEIKISRKELTKHTFVTGSTGSGKSNTIYKLIENLCIKKDNVKFLVIEPTKGEYKNNFGGYSDVTVYGTNPNKFEYLLQINPFSFPDDIHVLEHIDRLVEVFNACWPMYAAMPAILKESIEKVYEKCGWNLRTSNGLGVFPTFNDLIDIIPQVVDSSNYSGDTSSDYKGALVTRVRSLTRGIHGQIFERSIDDNELFNKNVIIDISRIGSQETKSLIMGILVLKLQEFRMSEDVNANSGLRHITILEEAHNLLRRTSGEQSQESSNLQGKSVEMLANAIAEMRTYGEGFVIADQSPGLMDMSVIRNTNTKIIMRLPDEGDRILVGRAAGLNDSQIEELSRLEVGVAAVSQSDWLEPVLCKVDEFKGGKSMGEFKPSNDTAVPHIQKFWGNLLLPKKYELKKEDVDCIRKWADTLDLSQVKRDVIENVLMGDEVEDNYKVLLILGVHLPQIKNILDKKVITKRIKDIFSTHYDFKDVDKELVWVEDLLMRVIPGRPDNATQVEINNSKVL